MWVPVTVSQTSMPPHNIGAKVVKDFLKDVPWKKVIKKAQAVDRGDRIYPAQDGVQDAKKNFRFDKGSLVDGKPEIILQANKQAENKSVREAAARNSHEILAKGVVDPEGDADGKKAADQILESFKKESA